jgi:hypothetical protein
MYLWGRTQNSSNENFMERQPARRSFGFNAGGPDQLAPLLGFFRNDFAEVGGRARKRRTAQVGKTCL